MEMDGKKLVLVRLNDGNIGSHGIAYQGTSYGYRSDGDEFYVLEEHAPHLPVVILEDADIEQVTEPVSLPDRATLEPIPPAVLPMPEPDLIDNGGFTDELMALFEWTSEQLDWLGANNVIEPKDLVRLGATKLTEMKGIGPARAATIIEEAESYL